MRRKSTNKTWSCAGEYLLNGVNDAEVAFRMHSEMNLMKNIIKNAISRIGRHMTVQAIVPALQRVGESFNIETVACFRAAWETAEFYEAHLDAAKAFASGVELLTHAIGIAEPTGLFLEFGVASGRTISHIASLRKGPVFGFDSFKGLPEDWRPGFPAGAFGGSIPAVPPNVELIIGDFKNTLPKFKREHVDPVSFIHIDCDLYSSTKAILDLLAPVFHSYCVLVFDEYFNYPGWKHHEHRAFEEFKASNDVNIKYEGFVPDHQQLCVIVERYQAKS